jgi:hypothetical protein
LPERNSKAIGLNCFIDLPFILTMSIILGSTKKSSPNILKKDPGMVKLTLAFSMD